MENQNIITEIEDLQKENKSLKEQVAEQRSKWVKEYDRANLLEKRLNGLLDLISKS